MHLNQIYVEDLAMKLKTLYFQFGVAFIRHENKEN